VSACVDAGVVLAETVLGEIYGYPSMVPHLFVGDSRVTLQAVSTLAFRIKERAPTPPLLVVLRHPDEATMRRRVEDRYGTDLAEVEQRLSHGRAEMRKADQFDHILDVHSYEATFVRLLDLLRD
jgi:guanylate kinase